MLPTAALSPATSTLFNVVASVHDGARESGWDLLGMSCLTPDRDAAARARTYLLIKRY
jgi:hypothetical protein